MIAKLLRLIWIILKHIPVIKGITFYILRNSRYLFWRFRGGKPVQLGPGNIVFLEEVKNQIGDENNFRLIEFGCAAGPSLIDLSRTYLDSQFLGFDIRKGAVREGQKYIERHKIKNVGLVNSNLVDLEDDISCDFLISRATLIYLSPKDLKRLLHKVKYKVRKKIIFQEIHSRTNTPIKHYYFAHSFKDIFIELGYEELFSIAIEDMYFDNWESKDWRGVSIVLERKEA